MKPILFNTDMVRAILADRKTVTRRVVKGADREKAEGIWDDYKTDSEQYHDVLARKAYPVVFAELWDGTIKPADRALYGWDANPWVGVIEFERISREEACENSP